MKKKPGELVFRSAPLEQQLQARLNEYERLRTGWELERTSLVNDINYLANTVQMLTQILSVGVSRESQDRLNRIVTALERIGDKSPV